MRSQRGFTLLELLMVVIVIGILASIGLPQYLRVTERVRGTEAIQMLGALRASQGRYRAQSPTAVFASVVTDLDIDAPNNSLMKYWNTAGGFNGSSTTLSRISGTYVGQTLGIRLDNGDLCGNFAPVTSTACP